MAKIANTIDKYKLTSLFLMCVLLLSEYCLGMKANEALIEPCHCPLLCFFYFLRWLINKIVLNFAS